ncbi:adenylate/guanylate cyclase domain-containing protein [Mesorhizobium caraganae]|uniref:Adenylate/guanylate cyclase domain-containing protein n=1 Tax=Mesorhizobium caraganae TaxID=483206 RepID=A0ABV1Z5H6_9HYPH
MNEESRTTRRLAAILAADVVGYSLLMGLDEEGTLAALKAHRKEVIDPLIAQHQGRIFKTTGDGLLIEFASIVDAVRCAVVVQQGIESRNANVDESRRIRFRIGINVGDVIVEGDDIFGDGVNVAARLEALAEPGRICVSATVREHVAEKIPIGFADLGEHRVKNIARPVHVFHIETRIEQRNVDVADHQQALLALPDRPSIAVLPFTNLSGDVEQDYLADGMVEDIITGLSRIKWLFVIARNSSFAYKGKPVNVKQAGRELGVRYILEGSVRKASNRVRVTGQLIEAESGRHVWADRYDRTLDDVFAIQDELTMSVVAVIEPSLRQAEIERVKRKRPDSLDAYDLVLRAIPNVYTAMPDGAAKALPLLESALEMEPDYALAHGFAAWAHEIIFARAGAHEENRLGATRHAQGAIAHGRDDALALSLGGFALGLVAHDREAARQAFEAALALSPSCALTYVFGSVVAAYAGSADRAIEWGERAIRLSPFDPISYAPLLAVTLGHLQREEYEAAAVAAHKVFQANPFWSLAHVSLAATQARIGRLEAAKAAAERVLELQPSFTISGLCAAFDIDPALATPLGEALAEAGLPA